jgi:hypothetical protein
LSSAVKSFQDCSEDQRSGSTRRSLYVATPPMASGCC